MALETFEMRYLSASCTIWLRPVRRGYISDLHASQLRQGHATSLMWDVVRYADTNDLELTLRAFPYLHSRGLTRDGLRDFYKRFGFETVTSDDVAHLMVRASQKKHGS